jgi:Ni,Fe-hydrogenase III large subunit
LNFGGRTGNPSLLTWPALPVALADTIVAHFPLANKNFNLSYAGNESLTG